ncbi:MAG: mraZ [Opitutaceae bacterium]|nr:mraZ [Opitutaceae bacterium]MBP9912397.1 mraZ [Opitutaceae bacterium]
MGHFGGVGPHCPMSQTVTPHYTGLFRHTLDDKNRLTIPSAWRFAHGENDTFLATPHPDGYIAVLPPSEVEKLRAKIAAMALSDGAGQDFVARFFAQTHSLWFDKSGRMNLSPELLQHAGVTKDAVLVGGLTKFNIYTPARWEKVEARTSGENFGDLMRRLGI